MTKNKPLSTVLLHLCLGILVVTSCSISFAARKKKCAEVVAPKEAPSHSYQALLARQDWIESEIRDVQKRIDKMDGKDAASIISIVRDLLIWSDDAQLADDLGMKKKRDNLTDRLIELQTEKKNLKEMIVQAERTMRDELLQASKRYLTDPLLSENFESMLGYQWIYSIPKKRKVTVFAGNEFSAPTAQMTEQLRDLAIRLKEKKYIVVYDADSQTAPLLREVLGTQGLGLSAKKSNAGVVKIASDYIRGEAMLDSEKIIVTPDSVAGFGLLLRDEVGAVLDPDRITSSPFGLASWSSDLRIRNRDKGTGIRNDPYLARSAGELASALPSHSSSMTLKKVSPTEDLPLKVLTMAMRYADDMAKIFSQNIRGAVLFGSAGSDLGSKELNYESSYRLGQLGIAMSTGGSGGAMETANEGAFASGSISAGFPLGGKFRLSSETETANSIQTHTILTEGYEMRIPALLANRQMVIVAPGGSGTLREVAATMFRLANSENKDMQLLFLDPTYYEKLIKEINKLNWPNEIQKRIHLISKANETEAIAKELIKVDPSIVQVASPKARKVEKKDWGRIWSTSDAKHEIDETDWYKFDDKGNDPEDEIFD